VLSVNGAPLDAVTVEDLPAVHRTLGTLPLDRPATLRVRRGEREIVVTLTPREKGAVEGDEVALPRWDFSVKVINRFESPQLYFHRKEGVFVYGVREPGNASQAGLRHGDILLKVGPTEVSTLEALKSAHRQAVDAVGREPRLVVTILRDDLLRQVVLDFSRDYERE
jgi:S1-C subfamily serine protease